MHTCMQHGRLDITVITTSTACKCIADHMVDELRPTAPSPHYLRPKGEGSEEMVQLSAIHLGSVLVVMTALSARSYGMHCIAALLTTTMLNRGG